MSYSVPAAQDIGEQTYTITGVIQLMRSQKPPAEIAFPQLGSPAGHTTSLAEGDGASIDVDPTAQVVRAAGLYTCASVCYFDTQTATGYVYHANTGTVSWASFTAAIQAMGSTGPPYKNVYVAYSHLGATDQGYQTGIQNLINWRVPTDNIVEITNLFLNQFGMNNLSQIGY